jgi:O-antigen/teichoic acid export membrane protein
MEETSFSYKTLKNSSYLFAGFLLPMVFTIFVTRALALKLGSVDFGIYLLVNAISSFVGFVDLGLSSAITKYASEYLAKGDIKALQNLLGSARSLFLALGFLGVLVFVVIGKWFLPLFHVTAESQTHILIVFLLAGAAFLLNTFGLVYGSILTALQRFDISTKLSMTSLIVTSLGSIWLLQNSYQLKAVMALNVCVILFTIVFTMYYSRKLLPDLRLKFSFNRTEMKKAYSFGFQTFISNLAASCLQYLDRLIIPFFLGPAVLPFYSVPGNIAIKIVGVTNSLSGMFFPMASSLSGSGEMEKLKQIYLRAFRNLSVVAAGTTIAIVLFAQKILMFWLGPEYAANGSKILVILAITYYFIGLYIPLQSILLGLGKMKFLIRQSILMSAINLTLLLILVPKAGILGAAWAYLIAVLPMAYAFYWTERNIFGLKNQSSFYLKLYLKIFLVAFVDVLIIYFLIEPITTSLSLLVISGPFSVVLYFVLYFAFGFVETDDILLFKSFFYKIFRIKKPLYESGAPDK